METQKKILVIDDDLNLLNLCARILTEEGFEVSKANSGLDALARIQEDQFDLLIVDLMLPDMNGAEIVQDAYAKYSCQAPVIFLTGMITKKEEVHNLTLKVENQQYLAIAKPFDRNKFVELVKAQLAQ